MLLGVALAGRRALRSRAARPGPEVEVMMRFARMRALALSWLLLGLGLALPASAAELRVLCPNALRAPVLELARSFVHASGHKVSFVFASVGAIHKRVGSGETVDVAIGTTQGVQALVKLGRALEGSDATIARSVLALAVRRDAAAADASGAQALAQTLRDADSLVWPDAALGGSGGAQVLEVLDRLGLAAQAKAKARLVADSREVGKRVATGAAAVGIAHMNDLVGVADIVVIRALLDPPTTDIAYSTVVVRRSTAVEAARAFIASLAGADAKAAFRAAGYATGD
jgi:molybdate transport system substrate-binding protein